jgi:hypothetical protein
MHPYSQVSILGHQSRNDPHPKTVPANIREFGLSDLMTYQELVPLT